MRGVVSALVVLVLLLACAEAFAIADELGLIVFMEQEVEILRNGEVIPPQQVYIGSVIENYDLLRTNQSGNAEVQITSPRSPEVTVKIAPNTSFSFEVGTLGGKKTTTLGMISGSVSLRVQKMTADRKLEVKSESATMGVRGTGFDVTTSPGGELLITCEEGSVSCQDESGRELIAEPGKAVEKTPGELFRTIPVAVSELRGFKSNWYAERITAFKANALRAIRYYASRYLEFRREFLKSYQALQGKQALLNKWIQEDQRGTMGSRMEMLKEKRELIGQLLRIRKVLFLFERIYFRLQELRDYYRQGFGEGTISPAFTTGEFFRSFESDRAELLRMMARVRYFIKLFALRNQGSFPADFSEEGEEDLQEEDEGFSF